MKKYFLQCLILFFGLSLMCCEQKEDDLSIIRNKLKIQSYKDSERMLFDLIQKNPDTVLVQECYWLLDSIQSVKISSMREQLKKDTLEYKERRPFSVTLIWGSDYETELTPYFNKNIKVLEKYLKEFPYGKYRYYFAFELIFSYTKKDRDKVIAACKILQTSRSPEDIYEGNFHLAMIYHEDGFYNDALKAYDNIIKGGFQKGSIYLYRSDCYYNLNEYDKAIESINTANAIEKPKQNSFIIDIGEKWIQEIREIQNNPKAEKRRLVYFQ